MYNGDKFTIGFYINNSFDISMSFLVSEVKRPFRPKSKDKVGSHPDRIYLATDEKSALDIYNILTNGYIEDDDAIILSIDIRSFKSKLMIDGQFKGGVYTTTNIPPDKIEIL
jgi:hypothetical protein